MAKYPRRLQVGTPKSVVFERRPELYFLRHKDEAPEKGAIAMMGDEASATFAIYAGERRPKAAKDAGPVYSAGPSGPLAVPTGRVFVRLKDGLRVVDRREQLAKAGYEIDQTLSYAPNAAWLRPKNGGVEQALAGLATVEKIPDVVHVEAQMILERHLKGV